MRAMPGPRYACAILVDPDGCLLLEQRPPSARHAAGRLTCFGGRVEPGESAARACRRELQEELGWTRAPSPGGHLDLWVAGVWMARFFRVRAPRGLHARQPGHCLRRLPWRLRAHPRISPWHRAVLGGSRLRVAG